MSIPEGLPKSLAPADNSHAKPSEITLTYLPVANAIGDLLVCYSDLDGLVTCVHVYTSKTSIPLSDLLAIEPRLAAAHAANWTVQSAALVQSADDLVAPDRIPADFTWSIYGAPPGKTFFF